MDKYIDLDDNNKDVDMVVDMLLEKLKQQPIDKEISVVKLLSTEQKMCDVSKLDEIAVKFFDKCNNDIEFINNSDEKIGLLHNLPFKKKSN